MWEWGGKFEQRQLRLICTARKVSVIGVILVDVLVCNISPYSVRTQENADQNNSEFYWDRKQWCALLIKMGGVDLWRHTTFTFLVKVLNICFSIDFPLRLASRWHPTYSAVSYFLCYDFHKLYLTLTNASIYRSTV